MIYYDEEETSISLITDKPIHAIISIIARRPLRKERLTAVLPYWKLLFLLLFPKRASRRLFRSSAGSFTAELSELDSVSEDSVANFGTNLGLGVVFSVVAVVGALNPPNFRLPVNLNRRRSVVVDSVVVVVVVVVVVEGSSVVVVVVAFEVGCSSNGCIVFI